MEQKILALANRRADAAEVFGEEADRTVVEFRGGKLHSQETRLTRGYGLRVIKDGKIGFCSSTDPDRINELTDAALDTSVLGKPAQFEFPEAEKGPEVKVFDNRVMLVSVRRMVNWGKNLIDIMHARVPDVKLDLTFTRTYREIKVKNSSGLDVGFERAEFDLWITGLLVDGGLVWIPDYVNLSNGHPLQFEPLADRLERQAKVAKQKAKLTSGTYPVIVMPTALPSMLVALKFGVNGKQREKGTSPLIGKEDEKILDENLTILDNPLHSFGLASSPFDGEGVARHRNVLFDKGVFKGFLFDLATAAACKCECTASARRGYSRPPVPDITNFEITSGKNDFEKLVQETKEGLLVYEFLGGGQSNIMAGDINLNVTSGFKIEGGEIVGRVKDVMVTGNLYKMLEKVEVGSAQQDLGNYFLPFVRFPALKVATKE